MQINITHLYPDFLNLYGDRGNICTLVKRLEWRGIDAVVTPVEGDSLPDLDNTDVLFLGGGSDREQLIVCNKLLKIKDKLKEYAESGKVIIAVCGGYQLLGNFYQTENGNIEGLGILDIDTVHSGGKRLIGNILLKCNFGDGELEVVGFENHGGRTNIKNHTPFGAVENGFGNNETDGYEGVIYKNVFATYLHGPLLPKNPKLCDTILLRALRHKYGEAVNLTPLDDTFEETAFENMRKKLSIISHN